MVIRDLNAGVQLLKRTKVGSETTLEVNADQKIRIVRICWSRSG
jgi:hypothetical protein